MCNVTAVENLPPIWHTVTPLSKKAAMEVERQFTDKLM